MIASNGSLLLLYWLFPAICLQSSHYDTIYLNGQRQNISFKGVQIFHTMSETLVPGEHFWGVQILYDGHGMDDIHIVRI